MPISRRQSNKSLRRCRSVASNILRSNRHDDGIAISPRVAQQHALAAATKAYGNGRIIDRTKSMPGDDRPRLQRSQSVRFTGPSATGSLQPTITRRRAEKWTEINTTAPLSPPGPYEILHYDDSYVAAPSSVSKTPGQVSSFKRLKKAKSMRSPRRHVQDYFIQPNSSPMAESSLRSTPRSVDGKNVEKRLTPGRPQPTAEEFLLSLPNPYQTCYSQADAVQLAREDYIRKLAEQRLERPSLSSMRTQRAAQKPLKRTVRSSSTNSFGNAVGSESSLPAPPESQAVTTGRKISGSIKGTLRRIFRANSQSSLPTQHVSASREHYGKDSEAMMRNPDINPPSRVHMDGSNSRSASPFLLAPASRFDEDATQSVRSKRSTDSLSASRSTSWGNSTVSKETNLAASVVSKNRLSVIQENIPHQPSSSANRDLGSGYAAFHKPLRCGRVYEPADAEPLVTALKKRIAERRLVQQEDEQAPIARAQSSMSLRSRCSIRKVPEEVELPQITRLKTSRNFDVEANEADDVFQPARTARHQRSNAQVYHQLSFQNIADLNEANRRAKMQETRATFFPSKGQYPEYRASPLKNSMKATVENAASYRTPVREPAFGSSESVYSRKITGTPLGRRRDEGDEHGTAYIFDTKPMIGQYQKLVSRGHDRSVSDKSMMSWKKWMALEVSKLEGSVDAKQQLSPNWTHQGFGHVREQPQVDGEDTSIRKVSGAKQILGLARKFSGSGKRKTSGHSTKTDKSQSDNSCPEISERTSSLAERRKAFLGGVRAQSNENVPPSTRTSGRQAVSSLSHRRDVPVLSSIEESPLTPFSKFMATDNSPSKTSPLLLRSMTSLSARRNEERETRLRRMKSSLPSDAVDSCRTSTRQYPWLHDYRFSPARAELAPLNINCVTENLSPRPLRGANRNVELFLSQQHERSVSPNQAFV